MPSTLSRRGSHFGIPAAQLLKRSSALLWQPEHEEPFGPRVSQCCHAFSYAHKPGFTTSSRLSRRSTGGGRLLGSSTLVGNTSGALSVLRNATMGPISSSLKRPLVPHGGITLSGS